MIALWLRMIQLADSLWLLFIKIIASSLLGILIVTYLIRVARFTHFIRHLIILISIITSLSEKVPWLNNPQALLYFESWRRLRNLFLASWVSLWRGRYLTPFLCISILLKKLSIFLVMITSLYLFLVWEIPSASVSQIILVFIDIAQRTTIAVGIYNLLLIESEIEVCTFQVDIEIGGSLWISALFLILLNACSVITSLPYSIQANRLIWLFLLPVFEQILSWLLVLLLAFIEWHSSRWHNLIIYAEIYYYIFAKVYQNNSIILHHSR